MSDGHSDFLDAYRYTYKEPKMGCDIHWYSETKKDGKWVCDQAASFSVEDEDDHVYKDMDNFPGRNRDYWWFGFIQPGVRTEWDFGFDATSLPDDLSSEVQQLNDQWDVDGHSHGHLTRGDFKAKLTAMAEMRTEQLINPTQERDQINHFVDCLEGVLKHLTSDVPDEDQRVVFWFDN
jgi:hypothetical protein